MAHILHIESSSTVCSVAISKNETLLVLKETNNGYTHAENLHVFIKQILEEAKLKPTDLNAVSISTGPGSYTGLRIGYSAAKGLVYALNIPLIEIPTLQALTQSALENIRKEALYCPLIDARRMEVYFGQFNHQLKEVKTAGALILTTDSISVFKDNQPLIFFGTGMPKAKEILSQLKQVSFIEDVMPSAKWMISLAYQKYLNNHFTETAYAEPHYVKDVYFENKNKA